jgi:putative membrane protein
MIQAATCQPDRPNRRGRRVRAGHSGTRRVLRLVGATLLILGVIGLSPAGVGAVFGTTPASAQDGVVQTKWGPLSDNDREVLVRVRLANLWERPVGLQAQDHSGSQRIKDVGSILAADHLQLDTAVLKAAAQLKVALPNKPNSLQRGWMNELAGLHGKAYDEVFTNRLRAAHGTVFGLIAEVRGSTENSIIRQFAQVGVNTVMKHMTLLEGTGLFTPQDTLELRAAPIHGPVSLPAIISVAAVVLVANLLLARRRSWL